MHNGLGNKSASIHFHGMFQNGTSNMDGATGVTQCGVPPGLDFTYNFTVNQNGTYWYHCHVDFCYPDGYRQALLVHDDDAYFADEYDQEFTLTMSDWYHELTEDIAPSFLSLYNPSGAEPIPQAFLVNDTQNTSLPVEPGTTYLLRLINIGAFVAQYFYIEDHDLTIVEIDGVYTEPTKADILYLAVAQRYAVLVTTKNSTDKNYAIVTVADSVLLDTIPPDLQLNNTNWLEYNKSADHPQAVMTVDVASDLIPFDDFSLIPADHAPLLPEPDLVIETTIVMANLENGKGYAFLGNISYTQPVVPSIYTVLSSGNESTNEVIYGEFTHSIVLEHNSVVQIILNNDDGGTHPFHLHGHNFQLLARDPPFNEHWYDYADYASPVPYNADNHTAWPKYPARRDVFVVPPQGSVVIRFVADNPGVWIFHCHIDWHLSQGLAMVLIEAPEALQAQFPDGVPEDHLAVCQAGGVPTKGNAAGNSEDFLDLDGQPKQVGWIASGFTARGIVALVFSTINAVLGMTFIAIYGWLDPKQKVDTTDGTIKLAESEEVDSGRGAGYTAGTVDSKAAEKTITGMSTSEPTAAENGTVQRHERPFLFNWNRRLRHLHGVLLRNVHTSAVATRARGKTITDDDVPYNLETPTKRALKNESRRVSHSQHRVPQAPPPQLEGGKSPARQANASLRRRRNTAQRSATGAHTQQPKTDNAASDGLPDTWFSLHSKNKQLKEPIYVSEVMEKSINPSFAFFDLEHTEPAVTRADDCIVDVNLRSLQFLGRNIDTFYHPLPPNCLLFQLSDGIYTAFTDLPGDSRCLLGQEHRAEPREFASSFDALMQLANLDDCIQDALQVRTQLEQEVNELLRGSHPHRALRRVFATEQEQHSTVYNAVQALRRQTQQLNRRKADLGAALRARRAAVRTAVADAGSQSQRRQRVEDELQVRNEAVARVSDQSTGQMRRVGEDLQAIFPIEPLQSKPLHFTIRKLYLPNSVFDDTNRDAIAAALGFTAQLVHLLSLYLVAPLPYPLETGGATTPFVHDPISIGLAQRKYPLNPVGVAYKFEYAVFLLNKDIEFLMNRVNLRALDPRHTLPNLKYLLYILTAGSGELPARKAGGIRGLLGGQPLSRRGSRGSQDSRLGAKESLTKAQYRPQRNGSVSSTQVAEVKPAARLS
ncbi:hypothetical protein DV738_g5203, partial [Chaetothyriales sp. CBS 135597]